MSTIEATKCGARTDIVGSPGGPKLEPRAITMAGFLPASRRMTAAQLRIRSVERAALAADRAFAMGCTRSSPGACDPRFAGGW